MRRVQVILIRSIFPIILPYPSGADDALDIHVLRLPAEDGAGFRVVRIEAGRVAGAALHVLHRAGLAADAFCCGNDLPHAGAYACAEVDAAAVFPQLLYREAVRLRKILHMDVVADAGAIRRVVICAKYFDARALAGDGLEHEGNEVCLRVVALADGAIRRSAGGVEVAQGDVLQAVGAFVVRKYLLHHELAAPVGVDGRLGVFFVYRRVARFAISGACAGEDDLLHPVGEHGVQKVQRADDVVAVVFLRVCDALAHVGEGGKVNDSLEGARFEKTGEGGGLHQVGLHKLGAGVHGLAVAIDEVICHHDTIAAIQ